MTSRQFDKQRWSIQTKVLYDNEEWKVRSVNFDTGVLVLRNSMYDKVMVDYKDVKLTS